jgi:hypothetical protein
MEMIFNLDEQNGKLSSGDKIKYTRINLNMMVSCLDLDDVDYVRNLILRDTIIDTNIGKLRKYWN